MPRAIDRTLEPHYAWIAAGIALAILYGSFFPFGFYLNHDPRGPLGILLHSGFRPSSRDDVVSNILLYIPFGFFVACALQRRAVISAAAAGFALSLFVEVFQFYDLGRFQELTDVCSNTLGAMLGGIGAAVALRRVKSVYLALLLACWFASRCYPASRPAAASIPVLDFCRYFAAWLAVGLMLEAFANLSRSRVALPVFLAASLLLRALTAYTEPAEIAGGAAAVLLWSGWLWRLEARATIVAALMTALVILLALAPFHFLATPRAFSWVPFGSFLGSPPGPAIRVFFEKSFLYGGLVWLAVRAGFSIGVAAASGAILELGLRLLQVYLPGRSAEVTDAMLVLMLAAMMKLSALALENQADSA
ncbi:MAG TPA: VanZ family protein [Bryobacteraceae bacterium]|nr:VanZ family protein [Bryobacteraceae bacterium]